VSSTSRYEIFQKPAGQQPAWVETATSLNDAKKRLKELAIMFPADYFIFDTANSCFIVPHEAAKTNDSAELEQRSNIGAGSRADEILTRREIPPRYARSE
jgi:hypothetical protein